MMPGKLIPGLFCLLLLAACSAVTPAQNLQFACDSVTTSVVILTPYKSSMTPETISRIDAVEPLHTRFCEGQVTDVPAAFAALSAAANDLLTLREEYN